MADKGPRARGRKGTLVAAAAPTAPAALPESSPPSGMPGGVREEVGVSPAALRDFTLLAVLGKGSYGTVFKAQRKSDQKVLALKVMKKDLLEEKDVMDWVEREQDVLRFLSKLPHPSVVRVHHIFENQTIIGLAFDFLSGGDLRFHLSHSKGGRFDLPRARFYFVEVALTLDFLHRNRVIYRDLKPANVLLNSAGYPVLADFGFAEVVPPTTTILDDFCGSPDYVSPEMIHNDEGGYGFEVDWWAAGVMLYEFLTGVVPWNYDCVVTQYKAICNNALRRRGGITDEAWELLSVILQKKLEGRAHGLEALKAFRFFEGVDWEAADKHSLKPPFVPSLEENDIAYFDSEFTELKPAISNTQKPKDQGGKKGGAKKGGKQKK